MTKAYLAMNLKKDITVSVLGVKKTIAFDYLDGLQGVMLVFDTEQNARKYTDGALSILEIIKQ